MKKWSANKNLIAIISLVVLVVVAAIGIGVGIIKSNQPKQNEIVEKVDYTFYQSEPKFLDNHDDIGAMILDCDDESCFNGTLVNASFTSREGEYVQGKGALKISSFVHKSTVVTSGYFLSADISEFAKGSIHVSLYVSDTKYLGGDLIYELTSSGTFDKEEMAWIIPASALESGWNELYLGIEDAIITGGEPDLSKIKYFRMYGPGGSVGLDIIMDCIYATNTPGMSLEAKATGETASAKAGYLMDFDTLDGIKSSGTLLLSTAKGEYKEGEGAVIISNPKVVWVTANLKTTDLSAYKNGKLSFWVYINDASYVKDGAITVELSSSGTFDKNEISWRLEGAKLKTGWNEVVLSMSRAANSSTDKIDLTKVNYLRIFGQKCDENLSVILDAMRVLPPTKLVPSDGMILNCDTQENMIVTPKDAVSLTTVAGEYKEGTGAFKNTGSGIVWWQVIMQDLVDVSKYKDGGIHLWLYVSDASKLDKAVNIELGSGGQCDVDEYQWVVTSLNSGWNELLLDFESAIVTGKPDLNNVNFLRVFGKRNADITVMLDDVRAVEPEKASSVPGMIATCDSSRGLKLSKGTVTITEGEFKEGKGAYKLAKSDSNVRVQFTLNQPVDISEYADGRLHLWLYVDNPDNIYKGLLVELGNDESNFYRWVVAPDTLQSGWNELYLNFADVYAKVGEPNFAEIDYFRMLQYTLAAGDSYKEMTTIVDDIRAVEAEKVEEKPVVPGMIADCDSSQDVKLSKGTVTTTEGEFKEGKGAYKLAKSDSNVRVQFTLNQPVDISEYADGRLHLWLYVDNPDNIYKGLLVELGNDESNFYRWVVAPNELESGWNELELKFEDVYLKLGEINLAEIDYFRMLQYTLGANDSYKEMVTIVDDIRAVEAEDSGDDNTEEKPVIPGMILDCDSKDNMTVQSNNNNSVTNTTGEFKEGTGAFKNEGKGTVWWAVTLNNPVDISAYDDGGIHVWLYVSDVSKLSSVVNIEVGSGGTYDKNEYQWFVDGLQPGWNELYLDLTKPDTVRDGELDFSKINWFRVYASCSADIVAMVDDVRAVEAIESEGGNEEEKPVIPGMLADCDSTEGLRFESGTANTVTTTTDEFKEGEGAFKLADSKSIARTWIWFDEAVDVSKYSTSGYLHFWFKIDDPTKLNDWFLVDIGHDAGNMFRWKVAKGDLVSGWNEFYLPFKSGSVAIGSVDFTKINMIRISQSGSTGNTLTTIVDDIRLVDEIPDQVLEDCDDTEDIRFESGTANTVTTTTDEFKEGEGAFKLADSKSIARAWIWFDEAVDISKYSTSGYLHFWFKIDDPTKLNDWFLVDIGHDASNMFRWKVAKSDLVSGWNEFYLPFESGSVAIGSVDFTKINMIRISQSGSTGNTLTTIVDDIRLVDKIPDQVLEDCDDTEDIRFESGTANTVTTTTDEFKEGEGAFKLADSNSIARTWIWFDEAVDVSKYSTSGYLHFWFKIDDPTLLNDWFLVDIGHDTSNMFRWKVAKSDLVSGWNEFYLPFKSGSVAIGSVDFTKINMIRISQSGSTGNTLTTIVDDIRIVASE